ncbi:MAG: glycosyltransferase family 39 protein [Phycisphaerales bacterium]|nr:glycosyltransferase family 39 protein [Phycisphaerales bacterium]
MIPPRAQAGPGAPSRIGGRGESLATPKRDIAWMAHVTVLLICLAAALVNQSSVHWRSDLSDDRLFAYFGWLIGQGGRPYLDFWDNKPPGIFWVNALASRIGEQGPLGAIATCGAAVVLALLAVWRIAGAVFAGSVARFAALGAAAVLMTHLRFECGANRTETFVTLCETIGVAAYLRWRLTGRGGLLCVAAVAFGAAPLFKQSALAAALACAAHFTWTLFLNRGSRCADRRPPLRAPLLLASGAALLLPAALALTALSGPGQLAAAWHAVVQFNRAYFEAGDASLLAIGPALRVIAPATSAMIVPLGLAVLGAAIAAGQCIRHRSRRNAAQPRSTSSTSGAASSLLVAFTTPAGAPDSASVPSATRFTSLLWCWLLLAVLPALIGPGRREYHLSPALPPLALLAVVPLATMLSMTPRGRGLISPGGLALTLTWAALLIGPARDSLEAGRPAWAVRQRPWSLERSNPDDEQSRGRLLQTLTQPADRIYVFGWSPGTYRYALRRPASRFCTLEKTGQVGEFADFMLDAVTADLRTRPPAACFISPTDLLALADGRTAPLAMLLHEHYTPSGSHGGMLLFLRRNPDEDSARQSLD